MNSNSWTKLAIGCVIALAAASSCRHDPIGTESLPSVCFTTDVLPIIQSNCAKSGCHHGLGDEVGDLRTAAVIRSIVSPGKPYDSRLYSAITDTWGDLMPPAPNAPLSRDARTTIFVWILQGADTSCPGL